MLSSVHVDLTSCPGGRTQPLQTFAVYLGYTPFGCRDAIGLSKASHNTRLLA